VGLRKSSAVGLERRLPGEFRTSFSLTPVPTEHCGESLGREDNPWRRLNWMSLKKSAFTATPFSCRTDAISFTSRVRGAPPRAVLHASVRWIPKIVSPRRELPLKYADGYVLFIREGALMAQPFDLKQLEFSGEPFLLSNRSRQKMLAPAQIRLGLDQELLIRVVRAANQEFACRRHRPCAFLHQVAAIVRVCEMEQDIPGGLPAGDHPHRRSPPFR